MKSGDRDHRLLVARFMTRWPNGCFRYRHEPWSGLTFLEHHSEPLSRKVRSVSVQVTPDVKVHSAIASSLGRLARFRDIRMMIRYALMQGVQQESFEIFLNEVRRARAMSISERECES